jgi:hypothetical protein
MCHPRLAPALRLALTFAPAHEAQTGDFNHHLRYWHGEGLALVQNAIHSQLHTSSGVAEGGTGRRAVLRSGLGRGVDESPQEKCSRVSNCHCRFFLVL